MLTAETNEFAAPLPEVERLPGALAPDGVVTSCDYYPDAARIVRAAGAEAASRPVVEVLRIQGETW